MDINVKVTVDLGDKTIALVNGAFAANAAVERAANTANAVMEKYADDAPKSEPEKPTRTRRTKEQIAAEKTDAKTEPKSEPIAAAEVPAPEGETSFADLDGDAKLEKIKSTVTKYTKVGKSADIKFMLAQFEAGRASELAVADYDAFFAALQRYGAGEKPDEIFASDLA